MQTKYNHRRGSITKKNNRVDSIANYYKKLGIEIRTDALYDAVNTERQRVINSEEEFKRVTDKLIAMGYDIQGMSPEVIRHISENGLV